jgi:hypothetical protein
MTKHWDYEDDHDWDDNVDYKSMGYVYWYGKYYPKEKIDALFKDSDSLSSDDSESGDGVLAALAVAGIAAGVGAACYCAKKAAPHVKDWCTVTAIPGVKNTWNKITGKRESASASAEEELSSEE